ncbi:hypothetical protein F3Y22_tig00111022pilonHSYRG00390 [Hibiscus syriacus]|uniref:Pectinesterase catalytic domain-containing protein n=1 Tax=Hibiscus syriacus TaxID=106335 RepID=A0A6A2Z5J0_HIBSY|nr:hypothetical protein F3Y22_tig00111022pilonHSYRG00390 [Hibiscus syriacus]
MADPEDAQRKRKIAIIAVSSCLLVAVVVAVTVGVGGEKDTDSNEETSNGNKNAQISSSKKAVQLICQPTEFKDTCEEQLIEEAGRWTLKNCATIAYQQACLDRFQKTKSKSHASLKMKKFLNITTQLSRIGLAIACELEDQLQQLQVEGLFARRRRLLGDEDRLPVLDQGWNRRRLHQDIELNIPEGARRLLSANLKPDLVVAKDGSGYCKTLNEAKQKIPRRSTKPFVIHVKEGVYAENVEIPSEMAHVVLIADGKDKTRITGNISSGQGGNPTTFFTATFDTLYAFTKRQFYRDCTISGRIDFIFGDASVIFQNCTFLVRKPQKGKQNVITVQKRSDKKLPTGTVIHGGQIIPAPELSPVKDEFPVYLGRPWGALSTTIIMETYIDDMVHPDDDYAEDAAQYLPPKFFAVGDAWIKHTEVPCTTTLGGIKGGKT